MKKSEYKKLHRIARKAIRLHWNTKNAKYIDILDNKKTYFIFDIVFHGMNPQNLKQSYNCVNSDYSLYKHFGI